MSNVMVPLGLKKTTAIPQDIVLPGAFRSKLGIPRRLFIQDRNQQVPEAVRDWMIADPRYNSWFVDATPSTPVPEPEEVVPDEKKPEDEDTLWSESDLLPALKSYARRYKIDFDSSVNKSELIERIRATRGEFEES